MFEGQPKEGKEVNKDWGPLDSSNRKKKGREVKTRRYQEALIYMKTDKSSNAGFQMCILDSVTIQSHGHRISSMACRIAH